jgi:hypothetical protein
MSLLKVLQRLYRVNVPWAPPANPAVCRLLNQIVLGEESDQDDEGNASNHLPLTRFMMGGFSWILASFQLH